MSAANGHDGQAFSNEHPAPMGMLIGVFLSLLVLTYVTVAVAYVDLGELNLIVAMTIATLKASLVAWFFMHLSHDTGFNRLAFFMSFFFVGVFVSITLMDRGQYDRDMEWQEHVLPAAESAEP